MAANTLPAHQDAAAAAANMINKQCTHNEVLHSKDQSSSKRKQGVHAAKQQQGGRDVRVGGSAAQTSWLHTATAKI